MRGDTPSSQSFSPWSFIATSYLYTPLANHPQISSPYPQFWVVLLGGDVKTVAPAPPPHFSGSIRGTEQLWWGDLRRYSSPWESGWELWLSWGSQEERQRVRCIEVYSRTWGFWEGVSCSAEGGSSETSDWEQAAEMPSPLKENAHYLGKMEEPEKGDSQFPALSHLRSYSLPVPEHWTQ